MLRILNLNLQIIIHGADELEEEVEDETSEEEIEVKPQIIIKAESFENDLKNMPDCIFDDSSIKEEPSTLVCSSSVDNQTNILEQDDFRNENGASRSNQHTNEDTFKNKCPISLDYLNECIANVFFFIGKNLDENINKNN